MATIVLRSIKGSPLTIAEADANFNNLNTEVGTKLASSDYTAADVLTKIKTVDGTGSGLDADLLDGLSVASTNTVSTVVVRDSSGNFAANTITAVGFSGPLTGNVTGTLTGSVTGNATNVTGIVPITNGGTGAADVSSARTALGLGTIVTQASNSISITGGSITGITDLALADGGTGASSAIQARTNLGLTIGADIQPFSNELTTISAQTGTGIYVRVASNSYSQRTLSSGTNISITNADGIAGNPTINSSTTPTVDYIVKQGTNGSGDIGQSANRFNVIYGTSTSARYADLAEKYLADKSYETGTVLCVGGEKEVTASTHGDMAIGVVSANPAYIMNDELVGGTKIALKGRVPVKVIGAITKGKSITAHDDGYAIQCEHSHYGAFGIALESSEDADVKLVECVIL